MKVICKGRGAGVQLYLSLPKKVYDKFPPYFTIEIDTATVKERVPEKGPNRGSGPTIGGK